MELPTFVKNKRARPRRFEKMLLANIVEDKVLERRLTDICNKSNRRMKELDLECNEMKNEMKLNQRNLSLTNTRTLVPPTKTLSWSPQLEARIQKNPVSKYLLTEYTRTAEVIPSILHSLSAKEEEAKQEVKPGLSRPGTPATETSCEPDIRKILRLAKNVRKLHEHMEIRKQRVNYGARLNFKNMLRLNAEKKGESDIYTDGACSLLRRKMLKMRRNSLPSLPDTTSSSINVFKHNISLPLINPRPPIDQSAYVLSRAKSLPLSLPLPLNHSRGTLTTYSGSEGRLSTKEDPASVKKQMFAQRKVSEEIKNYDKILTKINSFLGDVRLKRFSSTVSQNSVSK
ncbi:uncharacterized protein LOC121370688 [Gigantopelta aegis]|uniref:uncharacterized protein LOC121370688 n=1 Tax=Gigantopelta aegis TaxID=1735272 RepID=UPI001B889447|nr:uncharacterized protein LOC121370688 [Gigantopelta aegis]XP_041352025.1 uncharacterized protein LOC121370688 [Gigantopelta aegis]